MPVSIARRDADYPALSLKPDAQGDLVYAEGRRVGYRGMADPRHTLGAGFGYADIAIVAARPLPDKGEGLRIAVTVENRSDRAGSDVVQIYRREPELALAAFAKLHMQAGERREVVIDVPERRLQHWCDGWRDISAPHLFVGRSAADIAFDLVLPVSESVA